jgi:hypothetical protein
MAPIDLSFLESQQTLIPFLFVLAIIFGVLELVHVFRNRAVNFLIALAIAFFTVTNTAFVDALWSYFGVITAFFIIMFFIAFVLEIFGLRKPKQLGQPGGGEGGLIIVGVVILLLLSFGFMYSNLLPSVPIVGGGQNLLSLFIVIFILVMFWMAYKVGREPLPMKEEHQTR